MFHAALNLSLRLQHELELANEVPLLQSLSSYDTNHMALPPLRISNGLIRRSKARQLKEALNGLVQKLIQGQGMMGKDHKACERPSIVLKAELGEEDLHHDMVL